MYDVIIAGARVAGAPTAMLLARRGHKVLLVDRATFPSDTMSTHYIHQPGVAALKRWGVLDQIVAAGTPAMTEGVMDLGPFALRGWGPDAEGVLEAYAPRRTLLDKVLVDAAAEAGAEVREGFSIQELTWQDGRVTGIRGRTADGQTVTANARLVVGADGMRSAVAKQVAAPAYNEHPALACYYYNYFSGAPVDGLTLYVREGRVSVVYPTNDNLTLVGVGWPNAEFHRVREDIEGNFYGTLDEISSELGALVHGGRPEERWVGTADIPNFFRKPWGNGWALVGDAGYHKDPITGYGITDALRDAGLLAEALDAGLGGVMPMDEALVGYERRRNEFAMPMYEFILGLASMQTPPEIQQLMFALQGNDEGIRDMFGVIDGTVPVQQFFSDENIGRIMARAQQAA